MKAEKNCKSFFLPFLPQKGADCRCDAWTHFVFNTEIMDIKNIAFTVSREELFQSWQMGVNNVLILVTRSSIKLEFL